MIIKNIKIYQPDQTFVPGVIITEDDHIKEVYTEREAVESTASQQVLDGQGCYCIPGMIDLHFHGCKGADFCDGTREVLDTISQFEASIGVTAISPATMTLPVEKLEQILENAADYRDLQEKKQTIWGADLVGVNMEGPFISKVKKGAQDEKNIIPCDVSIYKKFQKAARGLVKFVGIAPEESDCSDFIKEVK